MIFPMWENEESERDREEKMKGKEKKGGAPIWTRRGKGNQWLQEEKDLGGIEKLQQYRSHKRQTRRN